MEEKEEEVAHILNGSGLGWAEKFLGRELTFKDEDGTDHQCPVIRYEARKNLDTQIPYLALECRHGFRTDRAISFKYRWQDQEAGRVIIGETGESELAPE